MQGGGIVRLGREHLAVIAFSLPKSSGLMVGEAAGQMVAHRRRINFRRARASTAPNNRAATP